MRARRGPAAFPFPPIFRCHRAGPGSRATGGARAVAPIATRVATCLTVPGVTPVAGPVAALCAALCAALGAAAAALPARAAEPAPTPASTLTLTASGQFKPRADGRTIAWPAGLGFSASDLAAGSWSATFVIDRSAKDPAATPEIGRYAAAVRSAQVTLGTRTLTLPASAVTVTVSDGGQGTPWRESLRIEAALPQPGGDTLHVAWTEMLARPTTTDLRGPAGLLDGVGLPPAATWQALAEAGPFDAYLSLRLAAPGVEAPRAYVASSTATVTARDGSPQGAR